MGKSNVDYMTTKSRLKIIKKRKYRQKRNCYINLHLIDGLGMQFTAC